MSDEIIQETLQPEVAPEAATPEPQQEQKNNFEELRKQKARVERERDEAMLQLRNFEAQKAQAVAQKQEEQRDSQGLAENDIVEGKHLKQVNSEMRQLREDLKKYQQQSTEMTTEARLKAQYPDFDTVVSKDNVEALRNAYPEIAQTLNSSSDLYNKAASAYTLIKKFGIGQPDPFAADRAKAQENAAKPRPSASLSPQAGDSPMSNANAFASDTLSADTKKQLYKEMLEAMKYR